MNWTDRAAIVSIALISIAVMFVVRIIVRMGGV